MKLNKFTDYNLRVLIYLALNRERLCTIQEVANAYNISENHLMKVTHHLAKNKTIYSKRGKGGGIQLIKNASEISLADIIRSAEGDERIISCKSLKSNEPCCITPACKLPKLLKNASEVFYQYLENYSLQYLLNDKNNELMQYLEIN